MPVPGVFATVGPALAPDGRRPTADEERVPEAVVSRSRKPLSLNDLVGARRVAPAVAVEPPGWKLQAATDPVRSQYKINRTAELVRD